jgi:hypothetical protein
MSLKDIKIDNSDDVMLIARIAEQSEQYDDMIDILKPFFEKKEADLNTEERNILCLAYKNAVGMRRIAWRAASAVTKIPKYKSYNSDSISYAKKLEEELVNLCKDMLNLISKHLLPKAKKTAKAESEVFY